MKVKKVPIGPLPVRFGASPGRRSWGRPRAITSRVNGGPFFGQPCALRTLSSLPLVIDGRVGQFESNLEWKWLD